MSRMTKEKYVEQINFLGSEIKRKLNEIAAQKITLTEKRACDAVKEAVISKLLEALHAFDRRPEGTVDYALELKLILEKLSDITPSAVIEEEYGSSSMRSDSHYDAQVEAIECVRFLIAKYSVGNDDVDPKRAGLFSSVSDKTSKTKSQFEQEPKSPKKG